MKKLILFLVSIFCSAGSLFGQFEINRHIFGPSVGLSFLGSSLQIGLNHEYGINLEDLGVDAPGKIGFGGLIRYWNYSETFTNVETDYSDFLLGIQSNYHFYMANDFVDPWIGIVLAYNFGSSDTKIKTIGFNAKVDNNEGIWISANAGAKYWIQKNMAIGIRIGFGTLSYGALDIGFDYNF